ncbi:MAG: helix-turn-helix domain-containing protein [Pseudomonadota bacterium]
MIKTFDDQNYYDILEIPVNASPFEIRQAYKEALSVYSEDSLSTYAFFDDRERAHILDRIEEAFFTLIDEDKKIEYDRRLVKEGKIDAALLDRKKEKKAIPLFQASQPRNKGLYLKKIATKLKARNVKEMSNAMLSKELISGGDLKNLRKAVGIGIDEIYEMTRINVSVLKAIEDDQYESLPPEIYLKNFLRTYAETLQIDSKRFVEGYLKNLARRTIP